MRIPAFVKQLAKVCDTESSRYALGGIRCQSDGTTAHLTATDGRVALCLSRARSPLPQGGCGDVCST